MNVRKLIKTESNPNKKWDLARVSLERTTLPLLAPRSTNWANVPVDTNVQQVNLFNAMNVRHLLKRTKQSK